MANSIPVISTLPGMQEWRQSINDSIKSVPSPKVPWNFQVSSRQGGNYLTWQQVGGADGYIVDVSTNGDFSTGITSITLRGAQNIAYFDTVATSSGVAPGKRYYRVRATAGTTNNSQSVQGNVTGVVSSSAIAPNDTTTVSTTGLDTTTNDSGQSNIRNGSYSTPFGKLPRS